MRISTICYSLTLSSGLFFQEANSQSFDWATRAGSYAYDYGRGICTDGANNVYVTGEFELTGKFGGLSVNARGGHDIFVVKYNPYGGVQWVRRSGGTDGDVGHAISSDQYGNVYVTGEFQKTADFGHISIQGGDLNDIFLAKYDTYGNIKWVQKAGGYDSDKGHGVADQFGNVYLTGFFQGTATFGNQVLYSSGQKDVFLAKYNTNGTLLWVKKFGSTGKDEGRAVNIDHAGNVYVAGYFHNSISFGNHYLNSNGDHDGFLTKFDANGNVIWAKKVSGPYYEVAKGVTSDNYGNVYITGVFCYGATFNSTAVNPYGQGDIFIASYTSSGSLRWIKKAGSGGYDEGTAIRADGSGNVYVTGRFEGNAVFGYTTLYGSDKNEVFITSLTSAGNFRWAMKGGGSVDQAYSYGEQESGLAIAVDKSKNVYTTGAFRTNIVFGATTLSHYYHTDIFVSKIRQSATGKFNQVTVDVRENDSELLLSAEPAEGAVYTWMKDGEIVEEFSPVLSVTKAGTYNLVMSLEGESYQSDAITIEEGMIPAALASTPLLKRNPEIFPNPTAGDILMVLDDPLDRTGIVEIINNLGQVVQKIQIPQGLAKLTFQLDPSISNGVYMARVNGDNSSAIRLIVQRD